MRHCVIGLFPVLLALSSAALLIADETPQSLRKQAAAVLAQLDGDIKIAGLREPVHVLRDKWGIAHVYAKNTEDLFFAQGFVAAQDRLFQIDMWRRVGAGETAEVVGKAGLAGDRFARLIKYRGDMFQEWSSYSPQAREIAYDFTRGINAYIDHLGDRLPIEFKLLGIKPKHWRPEDCLSRMSGIYMSRNFQTELARAELIAAVGVEKARRIAPTDPARDFAPAPGLDLAGIDRTILAGYNAALKPLPFSIPFKDGADEGSNNWEVDGTLSASGKPMLASDPHRAITLPSLRYLVHLNAPGWNVIGSGEPGLPGVAIGHNEHVAWGFTIVGTDQTDIYVEETNPDDATQYRVGDGWQKMKVIRETVVVKGEPKPVEMELRFTRHGSVIHEDAKRHRAFALKWAGSEPGGAAYLRSLALDRVKNGKEFVAALDKWKIPALNMVYADVDGNIGWVAAGLTPVRQGWDGLLPVPGSRGEYEWKGFLPLAELPQSHNPAGHIVATANHNILPSGYKHEIAYDWAPRYRFARIEDRLAAKKAFTLKDFQSIQHDNVSLPGRTLGKLAKKLKLEEKDAELQPYADMVAAWDGELSTTSMVGALYGLWLQELLAEFYRPHVPAKLLDFATSRSGVPVMLSVLETEKADPAWFGDQPEIARNRLLCSTFRTAKNGVQDELLGKKKPLTWGELHQATFRHPLAKLGPAYAEAFNLGPVPKSGDAHTPNAASHNAKSEQTGGATYRHIFDLADWDKGVATSAPGQSGQPGSPFYSDLLPLWEKGQYFPLAYSREKVEEVTSHRLKLIP